MTYIMIMGNPVDGFRFVGPFADMDAALTYLETESVKEDYWIAELDAPAVEEVQS